MKYHLSDMTLSISTREVGDVVILDMSGRLSLPDPHLQSTLTKLIDIGHRRFVFNLADVNYIDSYGVQDLLTAYTTVKNKSGCIKLLRPDSRVRKLLEITIKPVFDIFDDEPTAV